MASGWRRCSACWGVCYWVVEWWVCRDCGSEWNADHNRRFRPPKE